MKGSQVYYCQISLKEDLYPIKLHGIGFTTCLMTLYSNLKTGTLTLRINQNHVLLALENKQTCNILFSLFVG